jgi:Flp pilus assembly protein TadD
LAHANLGTALGQHKGDWDGQIAEEHEALRLDPKDAWAHYALGVALEHKGDWRGALEEIRAAYELNPREPLYRKNYEYLVKEMRQ